MIKTINVTGEMSVNLNTDGNNTYFSENQKYCRIDNKTSDNVYASLSPNISVGKDDVLEISSGGSGILELSATNKIYISGSGKIQIQTSSVPLDITINSGSGGSGGGGSGGNGEENVIETVKVNGEALTVAPDKSVDVPVPTKNSQLQNDSDFATKTYVGEQIAGVDKLTRSIVETLPADNEASENVIYMIRVADISGNDKYEEYMKIDGTLQLIGDTSVDLSGYAKITDIPDPYILPTASTEALGGVKVDGTTITIDENGVISCNCGGGSGGGGSDTPADPHIYGASWDGTSTTKWTRTDDAAEFTDPVPYVAEASNYGSPFDNIQPWAGMAISERAGGAMVAIPKFWYKLTQNGAGMDIQIANKATDGFSVSPAHMDRGDGKGERDVVYIGRYHCAANYKSVSGQTPKVNITRSVARTEIHKLGSIIWQSDFAMRFTIWLLYIVEFADWNSQARIGYGCGNNSAAENMGKTDSMKYHTGTMQNSRTTYGVGVQYRNIEGLWDNVYDWCDGCYNDSNGLNIILNPSSFSDSSGGISAGTPSDGWPSAFTVKTIAGMPIFIPTTAHGSGSSYSCDWWAFLDVFPCVCVGGRYLQHIDYGLFFVYYGFADGTSESIGCRLMELP